MEAMTCKSRMAQRGPWENTELIDTWVIRPNGDWCCSFCGSLHPEDFRRLVTEAAVDDSAVQIDLSDKPYKIYVRQPGVRTAHDGGIKFFTWHSLPPVTDFEQDQFLKAVTKSKERFEAEMAARRAHEIKPAVR